MNSLLRFAGAQPVDPRIEPWLQQHRGELGGLARHWFARIRNCGEDVLELLHDGCPVACVGDAPFAYVNVFRAHLNIGFFRGAELVDPDGLLSGNGRWMRHVKLKTASAVDAEALHRLIKAAYANIRRCLDCA